MRRTLSWLLAGALTAAIGGTSLASSTDSFIPIQDPPEMSMGTLVQYYGSDVSEVTDRLMPTASSSVLRSGFTGNASSDDIQDRVTFDSSRSSDSFIRVPLSGETTAPYYRHKVEVQTNGPSMSIKRIGYCLINTNDPNAISGASFRYGEGDENFTNDVERNCGFNDDYPTTEGAPDTESAALSFVYKPNEGAGGTFSQIGDANNTELMGTGDSLNSASWNETTKTWTVYFAYRPSPALAKQADGWIIRAAAQDKAPDEDGEEFPAQMSQIFYSTVEPDNHVEGNYPETANSFDVFRQVSVGYFGAIISERDSVTYGTLRKNETETKEAIRTGTYLANAVSDIFIDASDFVSNADNSLSLVYTDKAPEEGQVWFQCELANTFVGSNQVSVTNVPKILTETLEPSIDAASDDTARDILSGGMSCQLTYGGGAEDASEEYVNEVTLAIRDSGSSIAPFVAP